MDCEHCIRAIFEKGLYSLLCEEDIAVFDEIKEKGVLFPEDAEAFKRAFESTASYFYKGTFNDLEKAMAESYSPKLTREERDTEWERIQDEIESRTFDCVPDAASYFVNRYTRREYYGDN